MRKRKRMKRKGAWTRNVGYRRRWLATRLYHVLTWFIIIEC